MNKNFGLWLNKILVIAVVAFSLCRLGAQETPVQNDPSGLETLLSRFSQSVLPAAPADVRRVNQIAKRYEQTLDTAGRWPDLKYQDRGRSSWVGGEHLTRVLLMAKAVRLNREAGNPNPKLAADTLRALKAWTQPDPQNPNWWWNRIGVPELVAEIATLLHDDLPPEELARDLKILHRSTMTGATGANLTWCAINQVILGCLEKSPQVTRAAYDRLYEEIRLVPNGEGIQPDFSFHQHGPQLYSGGYGLFFANDVGRFIYIAENTPFQIPEGKRKLFDNFMLDGMRWITRHDMLDYSTIGRTITRAGIAATSKDWSLGPISPAGPAYSLGNVVRLLSLLPGPRQNEYRNWSDSLNTGNNDKELTGNKQFWDSDYMVHRREAFMTSVKMFSTRILNAEIVNGEGRLSHHLSDGANFLYLTGHEYENIFPCWDWQKIPGTTAEQVKDMNTLESHPVGTRGKTRFVGGVSDGTYGLCAMDLWRGSLRARKSWFFFDDGYVCLGAGITDTNKSQIITDVNQTLLKGEVIDSKSEAPLSEGSHTFQSIRWVYHNHVGYLFPKDEKVILSNTNRTGRWSDFGSGSRAPVTLPVFNLWISHGVGCTNATYEYFVLPDVSVEEVKQRAGHPGFEILANQPELQAVWCEAKQLVEVAFWTVGKLQTPLGLLQVDCPCLLLARRVSGGVQVAVANPENAPGMVNIRIDKRTVSVVLPQGALAGSSISRTLEN